MKLSVILLILSASFSSFAAVVVSADTKHRCTVYRVTSQNSPALESEQVFETRQLYGLTIKDMRIDFATKSVSMEITKRVVLAFDGPLLESRVFVRAENPNFNFIVNQLNRDIRTFDKVCITSQNELLWVTMTVPDKNN